MRTLEPGAVLEMRERRVACLDSRFRRLVGAEEDLWVGLEVGVVEREAGVRLGRVVGRLGACGC